MTIIVKTIFKGRVAFPEKLYSPDAVVKVGDKVMSLKGKEPVARSGYYDDKFGREKYRLVYYKWQPQDNQLKLI